MNLLLNAYEQWRYEQMQQKAQNGQNNDGRRVSTVLGGINSSNYQGSSYLANKSKNSSISRSGVASESFEEDYNLVTEDVRMSYSGGLENFN